MMPNNDFVNRQWLIDEYHRRHQGPPGGALKMIEEAPASDVELKRKIGRWIWDDEGFHCSECWFHAYGDTGDVLSGHYHYCPHCGARLEGGDND